MFDVRMRRGMECIRRSRMFISIVGIIFVTFSIFAIAPQVSQAQSNFEQEWANLIKAAKQEGKLAIAAGGSPSRTYRPILKAFREKFGIKVEMSTGGGTATASRVLAERQAGLFTVDVALISLRQNNQRFIPSESLVPIVPFFIHPDVLDKSKWYLGRHWYGDKALKYTFIYHAQLEDKYDVWYNTDKVSEEEIATIKEQWDFFDARWKGKIAGQGMGDGSGVRSMVDSYFEPDRGPKWIKTYLLDAGVTFSDNRRILETWLVKGRFPLQAVSAATRQLRRLSKKGLPIKRKWLPKKGGYLRAGGSGCCISVFAKAPHPNAAKLFVNWFLSKEGQTLTHTKIPDLERSSLRNDIPLGNVVEEERRTPGLEYRFPDADPDFGAKQEEAQKWILKIWESRQK